jgi:hypothetical protein
MTQRDPRPPCLQILVARFSRYDLITVEAWNEFDEGVARWRVERLAAIGVTPISPRQIQERKRAKRAAKKNQTVGSMP